jgi:glycosyltransferase involved in cell wall biosynthesis
MHVAIEASTWTNSRGYGRFTRELTAALLRADSPHQFSLVVDSGAADALAPPPGANVVVVRTRRAVVESATADSARSPIDMLRIGARLSCGFDAVLFPTNYSFVPVAPGRFVAVVIHDAIPEAMPDIVLGSRRAQTLWHLKNRVACWRANLLATVSEASAREIRKHLPIGNRPLVVLTEGASSIFSPRRTPEDGALVASAIGAPGRFVMFVGGISPHKRVAELIQAFGAVAARPGHDDLRLVIVGPDGKDQFAADQSGVASAIAAIGAAGSRVVRTGFVSDAALAALYRAATVVVLPSAVEGFGLPALEAMSSAAPLIVARNAALEEVCGDGAEYVDHIDRLADVLGDVVDDEKKRGHLADAGLSRSRQFGWDEAARRLLAAIDRRGR